MSLRHSLGAVTLTSIGPCICLLAACAKQPPAAPPSISASHPLQGYWEDDGDSGKVSLTIEGNSLYFYARPDFQYDTTFTLVPGSDPPELQATILDSPRTTDSEGEVVIAIYEFEDGTLNLAAVDKPDGATASFDEVISRYSFERVQPPE